MVSLVHCIFATQAGSDDGRSFTACLVATGVRNDAMVRISIQNLRFAGVGTPKPAVVVFPIFTSSAQSWGARVRQGEGGRSMEEKAEEAPWRC